VRDLLVLLFLTVKNAEQIPRFTSE